MSKNKGWECPRCGDVYGPNVPKCINPECKKTPGEVSGEDLHEQLYSESILQFPDGSGGKTRRGGDDGSDGSSGIY